MPKNLKINKLNLKNSLILLDWVEITGLLDINSIQNIEKAYDISYYEKGTEHFRKKISITGKGKEIGTLLVNPYSSGNNYESDSFVLKFNNILLYNEIFHQFADTFMKLMKPKWFHISRIDIALDNMDGVHSMLNRIFFPKQGVGRLRPSYMPKNEEGKGRLVTAAVFTGAHKFENIKIGSTKSSCQWVLYNKSSEQKKSGKPHILKTYEALGIDFLKKSIYRFEARLRTDFLKRYPIFTNSLDILFPIQVGDKTHYRYEVFFKNIFNDRLKLKDSKYIYEIDSINEFQKINFPINEFSLRTTKMFLKRELIKFHETSDNVHYQNILVLYEEIASYYNRPDRFLNKMVESMQKKRILPYNFDIVELILNEYKTPFHLTDHEISDLENQ